MPQDGDGRAGVTRGPGRRRESAGLWRWARAGIPPLALWPSLVYLAIFYVIPVARVLATSLFDPGFTLAHYRRLVVAPMYGAVIVNTLEISLTVAIACVLLAYPTA